jgi:hypothetical protein
MKPHAMKVARGARARLVREDDLKTVLADDAESGMQPTPSRALPLSVVLIDAERRPHEYPGTSERIETGA